MRKEFFYLTGSAFLGIALAFGIQLNNVEAQDDVSVVQSHALYKNYKSLYELENDSSLIVKAKYTGERIKRDFKENNTLIDSVSETTVEVQEIIKGELKNYKDNTIKIYEPGYFIDQNTYVSTEGYNLLNSAGDYIIFLKENKVTDSYVVVGGYQGKYDTNLEIGEKNRLKDKDYIGEELEHFNDLKKEIIFKYVSK